MEEPTKKIIVQDENGNNIQLNIYFTYHSKNLIKIMLYSLMKKMRII